MAGVGFELKKLYSKQGLFAAIRANGYCAIVCEGPLVLGILLQVGIMLECIYFGRSTHDRELIICMNTYSLLGSLVVSSLFSMVITRFLADMLFTDHPETILPSFFGVNTMTLIIGGGLYGLLLTAIGTPFSQNFFTWCYFMELIVCWNAQSYLTAVKEYRGILISYGLAITSSLALAAGLLFCGAPTIEGILVSLWVGYGIMVVFDFVLICRRFPSSGVSPFMFLRWMDKYKKLALVGLLLTGGMFSHLIVIWGSPLQVVVEEHWIGAPFYDVPALMAFLTILVTNVSFVVSVEVNFYPKYREYFSLINDNGTIGDILRVESEMLQVLRSELWFTALKQLFVTATAISLGEFLLNALPLGFHDLMHGYFRTLCVGYGIYAVANTMLLTLLYFTDYRGALRASSLFSLCTTLFTILTLLCDVKFYGFGFLLGSAVFFVYSALRMDAFTQKLRFHILAAQPMVTESQASFFTKLGLFLERCNGRVPPPRKGQKKSTRFKERSDEHETPIFLAAGSRAGNGGRYLRRSNAISVSGVPAGSPCPGSTEHHLHPPYRY